MAGLSVTREQLRLVAGLRWNLFRNSLRTLKGRLEAVSVGLVWLAMGGMLLGGGVASGIISYELIHTGHADWLPLLLWFIFLYWQLSPLFAASVGFQFDFSQLLRFPLNFSSYFVLSLAYGLFDPGAVGSIFWLACLSLGVGLARPALFPWTVVIVVIFAAVNLFVARVILVWSERWLAQRKIRELLGFFFLLAIIAVQFIGPAIQHFQRTAHRPEPAWLPTILAAEHYFPPGFAGDALLGGLNGQLLAAVSSVFFLAIYAMLFFWLLRIRLVAQYHGELISETSAARPQKSRAAVGAKSAVASWQIPLVSSASGAMFEKEVRYSLRNWVLIFNILAPPLVIAFLGFTFRQQPKALDAILHHTDYILPVAIAYTFLIQMNWVFNSFAYDGPGIQFLFLAPAPFSEIMEGKNLFQATIAILDAAAVWGCVALMFQPPSLVITLACFAALIFATLANFAIGNMTSIFFPRRIAFGTFRGNRQAGLTVVFGMLTELILIGTGAIVFFTTILTGHVVLAIPIFLILACATGVLYAFSLKRIGAVALKHRETLTAELCRAE